MNSKMADLKDVQFWHHVESVADGVFEQDIGKYYGFELAMKCCLWGNKADSCFRDYDENRKHQEPSSKAQLVNDTRMVYDFVVQGKRDEITFVNDNSGLELITDIFLAAVLLDYVRCDNTIFDHIYVYIGDGGENNISIESVSDVCVRCNHTRLS